MYNFFWHNRYLKALDRFCILAPQMWRWYEISPEFSYRETLVNFSRFIGGGTGAPRGAGGQVAPPLFRLGRHGPPLFWPSCSQVEKHLNKHAVKCLTWWKTVHQIASFEPTFSKKLQLLRGPHPPQTPPCVAQARRLALTCHSWLPKICHPPPHFARLFRHLWADFISPDISIAVLIILPAQPQDLVSYSFLSSFFFFLTLPVTPAGSC